MTKFNPETAKLILDDIREGVPYRIAAESNDVAESTFYSWLYRGIEEMQKNIESEHRMFLKSLRAIERERIKEALADIRETDRGHRGREWEMERSFWKYFSSHAQNIELNDRVEALEKEKNENKD